jgi:uncharacterized protein (DUF2141 family)
MTTIQAVALGAAALAAFVLSPAAAREDTPALPRHITCTGDPNEIVVRIENVKESVGLMTAELYRNEPDNFLKKAGRELRIRVAAKAPATELCIHAPEPGQYAVVAYHDENANQKFDKTGIGFPAEPYGLSQNPKIRFAPPPLEKTLFSVEPTGASVAIKLRD